MTPLMMRDSDNFFDKSMVILNCIQHNKLVVSNIAQQLF